jgi:murein L,D-transpeptidase YafK
MDATRSRAQITAAVLLGGVAVLLAGCDEPGTLTSDERARATIPPSTLAVIASKGTTKSAPVLIRAYKKEAELEIWKMQPDGRYVYIKTFPMCRWSGQLGPKVREGDRQVPEGFYAITPAQMNPRSAYYLSFNVGYPNAYDRAMGRRGGAIMVHGACSSAGCFSMTDKQIAEIYAIAREAFSGGQRSIQMQSYPFRMTAENLAKYRLDPNNGFWKQLKEGSDNFDVTHQEVAVGVCDKRYVFNAIAADGSRLDPTGACPALSYTTAHAEVRAKQKRDDSKVAELVAQGTKPVRTVYADGGQHPDFAFRFPNVSRPDALTQGPVDVALDDGAAKKGSSPARIQITSLKTSTAAAPLDHDNLGSYRSKIMNLIDSKSSERNAGDRPGSTFPHPVLAEAKTAQPAAASPAIAEPDKAQQSWFAGLGRWFGGSKATDKQAEAAPVAVATRDPVVAPATAPVPQRRTESAGSHDAASRRPNPSAATARPIQGAARVVPTGLSTTVAQAQQAH